MQSSCKWNVIIRPNASTISSALTIDLSNREGLNSNGSVQLPSPDIKFFIGISIAVPF